MSGKRTHWGAIAAVLMLLVTPFAAEAQGISSILTRLEGLETRLSQMEQSRSAAIARVQAQLNEALGANSESDQTLDRRLASLEASVSALAHTENDADVAADADRHAQLQAMAHELAALREAIATMQAEAQQAGGGGGAPEEEEEKDQQFTLPSGIQLSGFVDASYAYAEHEAVSSTFVLDQVELDVIKELDGIGSLRFDVEWLNDGGTHAVDLEQGFLTLNPFDRLSVTFGKFNAPIGFESLDPVDMFQFSHALVFENGLPTNLTGAMIAADLGRGFDLKAHISNGWDQGVDAHSGKTVGGRLGYTYQAVSVGLSGMMDPSNDTEGDEIRVIDGDMSVAVTERFTLGGEYNRGSNTIADVTSEWSGFLLMGNVNLDSHGFTIRFDQFDDTHGSRLGTEAGEVRRALAFSPSIAIGGGMGGLFEIRYDWSDSPVFLNNRGQLVESGLNVAFELTYSF